MRIYLARVGDPFDAPVDRLEHLASLDRRGSHTVVTDPDDADVILVSQGHIQNFADGSAYETWRALLRPLALRSAVVSLFAG